MKWKPGGRSGDLQDMRGRRGGRAALPVGGGVAGLIVVLLVTLLGGGSGTGVSLPDVLEQLPSAQEPQGGGDSVPGAPEEERTVQFVSFVLDDVQNFWAEQFRKGGSEYPRAKLVLFRAGVDTGCGGASSATGPFYCPADRTAYLDLGFFRELSRRFQAPGDFAQAYVLAHEIAHHVQRVTGVEEDMRRRQRDEPDSANELSVRLELQADCLAGVWAHSTYERGILERGDLDEGLTAAAAVGDDRIQKEATGRVNPESFTHGTSEQRTKWFRAGFDSGDAGRCDTFSGDI